MLKTKPLRQFCSLIGASKFLYFYNPNILFIFSYNNFQESYNIFIILDFLFSSVFNRINDELPS